MAYTAMTQLPDLHLGQIQKPSSVPTLAQPITSTDTTITLTYPIKDYLGSVVTKAMVLGIITDGYIENIYVPASGLSSDGKTITGAVRGVRLDGLDLTTGDTSLAVAHNQSDTVWNAISGVFFSGLQGALDGTIGTGGNSIKTGDGTDVDILWYAYNGDANLPFFGYDASANSFVYSNDGISSTSFGTGAGVTGGDGITVTAGDIDIDLTDTVIFSAGLDGSGHTAEAQVGATYTEINQLSGTTHIAESNTFFGATDISGSEAETLTDGSETTLHKHPVKFGINSSTPTASTTSTTVIAHGLGTTPGWVKVRALGGYDGVYMSSTGHYDGTNDGCVYMTVANYDTDHYVHSSTSYSIIIYKSWGTTIDIYATITVDTTNITINWTVAGTTTIIHTEWECGI